MAPVCLEYLGNRIYHNMVIVFEDGTSLNTFEQPFDNLYPPMFVYHALAIPINKDNQQPAVYPGYSCWIIRRDGLRNQAIRLLVGTALLAGPDHTAFAVYQYDSLDGDYITCGGVLIVPTRNIYRWDGGRSSRNVFELRKWTGWGELLCKEYHYEVQLLFQGGRSEDCVEAEWVPGTPWFAEELKVMWEREEAKRREEGHVKDQKTRFWKIWGTEK